VEAADVFEPNYCFYKLFLAIEVRVRAHTTPRMLASPPFVSRSALRPILAGRWPAALANPCCAAMMLFGLHIIDATCI
jgi:hypothetical protein